LKNSKGYKILIVDDSKLARMAVNKALNSLYPDWERLEAGNAEEAIAAVKKTSPDVALLDFNMPGRDGLALAVELREANPHMAVAVVSANRQQEVVDRTSAAGATFLAKPITEAALGQFLKAAVQDMQARS
jgi:DNA-binding NarL/FixJ family response regulator